MTRMRVAVIPTTGRHYLAGCLAAIMPQVDETIVVAHNCKPTLGFTRTDPITFVPYEADVPNISAMWNLGLDTADRIMDGSPYSGLDVAILNDDVVVPPLWFKAVKQGMYDGMCSAGSSDQFGILTENKFFRQSGPIHMGERMSGFAFILNQDVEMRLDEQFQWWYGDDDLEWRAREAGGVVKVAGYPVKHWAPGASTVGELAAIAGEDRARFAAKWGRTPH